MPSPIVQIRIPQELLDQAKAQAEADRRSLSAWVRLLIEDHLAFAERAKKYRADPELAKLTVAAIEDMRDGTQSEDLFPTTPRHRIEEVVKETSLEPVGDGTTDDTEAVQALQDQSQRRRKPKACKHEDPIRKLGRPYCTDCGEFV